MSPATKPRLRRALSILALSAAGALSAAHAAERPPDGTTQPIPLDIIRSGKMPKRVFHAVRLAGAAPAIDGQLDELCWAEQGTWGGQLVQRQPLEGQPATEPTEFKILYDNRYLYVAIRCFDSKLDIQPFLRGKRDENSGDVVGVVFDSYFDKRTSFEFDVTAGGSQVDGLLLNDDFDTSWNAVYDVRVAKEDNAWTAEFRIPFSQLRYANKPEQTWGFLVWRWLHRNNEENNWQLIPQENPGTVFSLGELHGIAGLPRSRQFEIVPYAVGRYETREVEEGNPFSSASESDFEAGLDAKIGLTSDFILDLTINPDFGQVEVDPAEINLTTFETFFPERRPFFLEGKTIFSFPADEDLLFYSRRIGAPPRYRPATSGYVDQPASTRILGAGKVTGKNANGLSLGLLYSLSDEEVARISLDGETSSLVVQPLTHHVVARVQQDLARGNSSVGGMFTATQRDIGADGPAILPDQALTGGLDLVHRWNERAWYLDMKVIGSQVSGTPESIVALSRNPVHNYQRPDADHLDLDEGADSLDGWGGSLEFGKASGGKWRLDTELNWRSPGLELNDLGYLRVADLMEGEVEVEYVDSDPKDWYQRRNARAMVGSTYDFAGTHLEDELELGAGALFNNHWRIYTEVGAESEELDTRVLRGGPAVLTPGAAWVYAEASTDNRKHHQFLVEGELWKGQDGGSSGARIEPGFDLRAWQVVNIEARLSYENIEADFQYSGRGASLSGTRYIMGRMDQHTAGTSLRLEVNFTPRLSLAYFGNILVSSGTFNQFKLITNPRAGSYTDRFERLDANLVYDEATNTYTATASDGAVVFGNPDFDVRTLQSNLVLRWEYKAGSNIYIVWTQNREEGTTSPGFSAGRDYRTLFSAHPDNTFLIKASYWFAP